MFLRFSSLKLKQNTMSTPTENPTPEFLAENSGPRLQNTAIAFIVLLFLFAGLRWLSQHTKGSPFGLGDLFSYIGMGCIVGECILALGMSVNHSKPTYLPRILLPPSPFYQVPCTRTYISNSSSPCGWRWAPC